MDPQDIENWFLEPNDEAYLKTEERTGPPLAYVAEKLRTSLEANHFLVRAFKHSSVEKDEEDESPIRLHTLVAFRSQIIAYLAFKNMLALVNEGELFERLEGFSTEEFENWLDRIDQQGSVTG